MSKGKTLFIGVDVGNMDTKSSNCAFTSAIKPVLNADASQSPEDIILVDGTYYCLAQERTSETAISRTESKLNDDKMFILTLMAIGKEIVFRAEDKLNKSNGSVDRALVAEYINDIARVALGVGLPPGMAAAYKKDFENYYAKRLEGGVKFTYNDYTFEFEVPMCRVYIQDYAPIVAQGKKPGTVLGDNKNFNAADWGGYTFDFITFINRKADPSMVESFDRGCVALCEHVNGKFKANGLKGISATAIIDELRATQRLRDDFQPIVKEGARDFTAFALNQLVEKYGEQLISYPTILMGGTALLLKDYIDQYVNEHDTCFYGIHYINDAHCNATAYEACVKYEYNQKNA